MRTVRAAVALFYGFVLFYAIWVWFGGVMAARQIPQTFFKLVGQEPALALISFGLHFLPTVALLIFCVLLFALPFKRRARTVARTVVVGAIISYVFWLLFFANQGVRAGASLTAELLAPLHLPWWSWPALAAPLVAFTLTYVVIPKVLPSGAEA